MDAHEVMEETDSTSTPGLSAFAEVAHSSLGRAPLCWQMLQKLLPDKATVTPAEELLSPHVLDASPIITRANSQDKLAGDMQGLIKEERDCIPEEL